MTDSKAKTATGWTIRAALADIRQRCERHRGTDAYAADDRAAAVPLPEYRLADGGSLRLIDATTYAHGGGDAILLGVWHVERSDARAVPVRVYPV